MSVSACSVGEEQSPVEPQNEQERTAWELSRRAFLQSASVLGAGAASGLASTAGAQMTQQIRAAQAVTQPVMLKINGETHSLTLDTRTSLLDALREHLQLTGSK